MGTKKEDQAVAIADNLDDTTDGADEKFVSVQSKVFNLPKLPIWGRLNGLRVVVFWIFEFRPHRHHKD